MFCGWKCNRQPGAVGGVGMSEAEYMEDGADYLEEGCQRQTCDGCMAYNYCLIKEQEGERWED